MVLMILVGVSSTVTGAIRRVTSAFDVSWAAAFARIPGIPGCAWDISKRAAPSSMAATPPNFTKSLRFTMASRAGSGDAAMDARAGSIVGILSRWYYGFKGVEGVGSDYDRRRILGMGCKITGRLEPVLLVLILGFFFDGGTD
jgi:hypothetical protein